MVGRVLAQVTRGVRSADRVGLAKQVVREPDVAIGVGAAQLGERRARPRTDLTLVLAQELGEVPVRLAALEKKLERRLLVGCDRHRAGKPRDSAPPATQVTVPWWIRCRDG